MGSSLGMAALAAIFVTALLSLHGPLHWIASKATEGGFNAEDIPQAFSDIQVRDLDGVLHTMGEYKGKILAFPCRQFRRQEFETNEEIKQFVAKYGVTFPMFEVIEVNGPRTHPVFLYSKWHSTELWKDGVLQDIAWNFGKFLLDKEDRVFKYYDPWTRPMSLEEDIKKLLADAVTGKRRGSDGVLIVS
ncbi:thioredoxin-dependent peroxidase TPX1/2 [Besnoitia besnoiti]|uniref:Thioredoxin-dependent peroxidase TPX1/2 n=1 Tax=Besnoitia besnoiti TaxID=94643 RepID=A0A2A9MLX8_BESBE|nr:thioredoxin-dependent peroxidase TPX1/2 [Besnoitia besnoiti]PFH36717.1 thioredoxin-dependent peroxidase TPX1/2 [Besnoitia besnoiti]